MKRQGNNGLLFWLICIVASIAAFIYFRSQFTFGFLPLFVVLIVFMLLPSAIKEYKKIDYANSRRAPRAGEEMQSRSPLLCLICFFAIIVFGSLSLYSLGNYFNPKTEVYSNYHHHAIKVEGVKINSDNFLLAGNSENAFFDSPKYRGTVRVIGHDADSVTLSFRGLFNPFYRKVTSQRHVNLNSELITFNEGERVEIVSNELDERGEYKKISFVLKTEHESKLFGLRPTDKSLFVFTENSVTDTSSFDSFLISGYSLDGITADVPLQMDIRGINIVREQINIDVKRKDIFSTYRSRGYAIELQPEANIRSIKVGDRPEVMMSTYQTRTEEVNVPYDKAFYIGLGNNTKQAFKFKKDGDDGLLLCYEMPKYQSLSASGESKSVNLMITSSIIDNENAADNESGLLDNLTDNVLQFDLFHNVGNNFNLEPFFVSYVTGPTSEIMEFSLLTPERGTSIRGVKAGEHFPQVRSRNNTEWVISVENFRDTTPFKTTTLSWYLLAIIMLAAFSMILSSIRNLYVGIEYAMHLIVIAFVTVRMFLLWRVTVFPPVTSVSLYEFEHFRNMRWLNVTLICVGAYFVCINAMKFVIDYISSRRRYTAHYKYSGTSSILSSYPKLIAALPFIVGGLLYFGVLVLGLSFSSPVVSVLGPTLLYLAIDAYIYKKLDKDYAENYSLEDDGKKRYGVLLLSLLNMGAASAVTIIIDGGFGIMFTMFALFSFWLKINDIYQYTEYEHKDKYPKFAQLGLLLILVGLVVSYKNIFLLLVNNVLSGISTGTFIFAAGAAVVVLLLLLCVFVILKMPLKRMAMYASIASVVVFAGIVLATAIVPERFSYSHTAFRAKVHMQTAGEIMSEIETQTEQNKFLQASLNDWILHEYSEIGKEVNTFGEKGIGYFKIQPQSKLGAMWFAQTTDICLSRYIIAEHGKLLAWMFIIAFLALLLVSLVTPSNSRWTRIVFMQVTLILAVQALMIFLANTQAFIFFGQDFPIISLTSRLSSLYFFILAGIAICLALWGKNAFEENVDPASYEYADIMDNNGSLKNNILWLFLLSALILAGKATVINNGKVNAKYQNIDDLSSIAYYHDRTYDVDVLLAKMNKDFENYINPVFTEYQRVNGVPKLQKNMSAFVNRAFSDSTMIADSALANCETFTKRMLEQYRSVGSKNNSRNNIVYLQYRRVYDGKLRSRDTLEFRVRNEFYKYELPSKTKDQWKGSLIERPTGELAEQSYIDQHTGYSYAYIPAEFAADGNPIQLLKVSEGTQLSLVSSDAMMMTGGQTNVVNVKPVDYVMRRNRVLDDMPLQKLNYIARRLLLNGKWTFIYPHGHQMLWARNEAAKYQRQLKSGDPDVYLSINSDLVADIYNVYSQNARREADDKTVIVADGDGYIRAMVDYRSNPRYRVNPNDAKTIAEITDSLYMYGERGRAAETRYFGNFSRDYLRRGPGSSQKPILWSAVTSMYNTGWWNTLKLAGIGAEHLKYDYYHDARGKYQFKRYAGNPIESSFRSSVGDEGNGGDVGVRYYMYRSSNYYNSLMAYIGAFNKETLQNDAFMQISTSGTRDQSTLFRQSPAIRAPQATERDGYARYANDYANLFPQVLIGNNGRRLTFNKFLTPQMAMDTTALAPKGLADNFGLSPYRRNNSSDLSYFNMKVREGRNSARQLNEYVVRSVAVGSNTIWQVSPLKMAEMYGRLASLNKNYTLSLEEPLHHDANEYQLFNIDESYSETQNEELRYNTYLRDRKELLIGMSQVYGTSGTASNLLSSIQISDGQRLSIDSGDGTVHDYYVYGKTGTINGRWGDANDREDHLLATIITDTKLSTATLDQLKNMKFYVIYQADYVHGQSGVSWREIDRSVIEAVVRSEAFQKYMGIR